MLYLPVATNTSCPTWFYYSNSTQQCQCGYSMGLINCNQETQTVVVWDSYCATYSGHHGQFYGGVCPMRHRENRTNRMVAQLPTDPDLLNDVMCAPYNREGLLCGSCREGYGPAVYSLSLNCADCSVLSTTSAVGLYLLVVFFPITMFYLCIIIFHIKITSGPLMQYIIFCQGFSVVLEYNRIVYDSIISTNYGLLAKVCMILLESWNLHFLKSVIPPFCISEKLTGIDVLMLSSLTPMYPLLLVLITYILMKLHETRKYRVLLILWQLIHIALNKLRVKEVTGTAVINAFATFIFFSSTTTMYAVYVMTESVTILSNIDGSKYKVSLYYDPGTVYKSPKHLIFLVAALIQCVIIVVIPSLLMLLYPTRVYRLVSKRLHPRKQLAITAFAEALHCGFKDGLNGTRDYRSIAGIFLIAFPFFCIFCNLLQITFGKGYGYNICVFVTCLLFSLLLSYMRPCKSAVSNVFFGYYFIVFGLFALLHYLWKKNLETKTEPLQVLFIILFFASQIPALLWMGFILIRFVLFYGRYGSHIRLYWWFKQ